MFATASVTIPKRRDEFFADPPNARPSLVRGFAFTRQAGLAFKAVKAGARHERQ